MIPIFRAKLRPPTTAGHYVERPRLLRLLEELVEAPLALVVAPAGTGKTSLLVGMGVRVGHRHCMVVPGRDGPRPGAVLVRGRGGAGDGHARVW